MTEEYTFDPQTGLLTNQRAQRGSDTILDLSYEYNRGGSVGNLNGKTGHLSKIVNNLDANKNRNYEYDALGRLTKATGGATAVSSADDGEVAGIWILHRAIFVAKDREGDIRGCWVSGVGV